MILPSGFVAAAIAVAALPAMAAPPTTAPTSAQRAGVLKAFGDPKAAWPCLTVRVAAADHRFATVRFRRGSSCARWAFDGVNIAERGSAGVWKMAFEGSSFHCPLPRIPHVVQRQLGVCPAG